MSQTPEHDRVSKNGLDWKHWGPLSEQAAVGHGAGGLQL